MLIFNYREEADVMRLVVEKVEDSSKLEQAFENYMASKVPYVKGVEGRDLRQPRKFFRRYSLQVQ